MPTTTYNDNYSQTAYGGRGYTAPTPYQPAPQPNLFLPSQAPQAPEVLFVDYSLILSLALLAITTQKKKKRESSGYFEKIINVI